MHYILRQVVHTKSRQPIEIHLTEDEVEIGRKSIATLSRFTQISRHHAKFYKSDDGSIFLKDLNSLNGCFVNGDRIGSSLKSLLIGDTIGFGVTCDQIEEGFVCVLCTDVPPVAVKQEVIDISDNEEQEIVDSSINFVNNVINSDVPEPISASKSVVSNEISSETNATNVLNTVDHNVQTASENSLKSILWKKCFVNLVKCDSDQFKWPPDLKNSFMEKNKQVSKIPKHVGKLSLSSCNEDSVRKGLQDSDFSSNASCINKDSGDHKASYNVKQDKWKEKNNSAVYSSDRTLNYSIVVNENCERNIVSNLSVSVNQNISLDFRNESSQNSDHQSDSTTNQTKGKKRKKIDNEMFNILVSSNKNKKNNIFASSSSSTCKTASFALRSKECKINFHAADETEIPSKIKKVSDCSTNAVHGVINVSQNTSLKNNYCQITNDQMHDLTEQVESGKNSCSAASSHETNYGQPPFTNSNLRDKALNNHELQNNNQDKWNYSQNEEVIIISDDESYFDFKSSQPCVHIKPEPKEINDADICMQIVHTVNDEREGTSVATNIRKTNFHLSRTARKTFNATQSVSSKTEDFQNNSNYQTLEAVTQVENGSVAASESTSDNKPLFTDLRGEILTNHELHNVGEMNYSQAEEVIIISDDESYFDFKSSQTYMQIKKEPEEVDDNDDGVCGDMLVANDELESLSHSKPVVAHSIIETYCREESVESIQAFIDCTEHEVAKSDLVKNIDIPTENFFPVLSQNFENDETNDDDMSHSVDLSVHKKKDKGNEIGSTSVQSKDINKGRKTLLIDPIPMIQVQKRIKEKQELCIEKAKLCDHKLFVSKNGKKKKSCLNKEIPVSTGAIIFHSNLGRYKIPHKTKDNITEKLTEKVENSHISEPVAGPSVRVKASYKKSPVKKRPDKFNSRMGFLVNNVDINPRNQRHNKGEIGKNMGSSKKTADQCSVKKQSNMKDPRKNSLSQNKSLSLMPSNKISSPELPNKISSLVPPERSCVKNSSVPSNMSVVQNASTRSDVPNIPVSVFSNISQVLPNIGKRGRPVFNPRDPRQNRTNKPVILHDEYKLSFCQTRKIDINLNNVASSNKTTVRSTLCNRSSDLVSNDLRSRLIKDLLQLNVAWLQEQIAMKAPPPLVSKGAVDLPLCYKSYDSYVSSFYPMLMLEIWEDMYAKSKDIFASNKSFKKFYFSILSVTSKDDYSELKCEAVVNENVCFSPKEGNLIILELKESSTKLIVGFGYVFNSRSAPLDLNYVNASDWKNLSKDWLTNAKRWTFYVYVKKRHMNYKLNCLMKGNGLCYINNKLRLAEAMNYIKHSPLLTDILQPRWNSFLVNYSASSATGEYNSCQMEVIKGICGEVKKPPHDSKIILLQGPPGTGKTHTIMGIIEKLLSSHNSNFKILLAAPSNAAIDELGCRLIELEKKCNIKIVRVGLEEQVHMKMKPYFLEKKAEEAFKKDLQVSSQQKERNLQKLQFEISETERKFPNAERHEKLGYLREKYKLISNHNSSVIYHDITYKIQILKESHIILSTLSSCGLSILVKTFKSNSSCQFSCCIIDESTQCTELEILQPLVLGISKLILVGDHKQLPATVLSNLACKHGFEKSAFERFHLYFTRCYKKTPVYTLSEQFRMHSDICEFPAKHFYDRKLVTNSKTNSKYKDFPLRPYILLDILISQESSDLSSKVNCVEASVIVSICTYLQSIVHSSSSIGIITPYQAQRSLYVDALRNNPWYKGIEVNTVDGFQGREKDIIILSSVRANSQTGSIGFLASKQRLNVAITRARKCLIICAHTASLMQNEDWGALVLDANQRNVCVSVTSPKDIPMLFRDYMKKR